MIICQLLPSTLPGDRRTPCQESDDRVGVEGKRTWTAHLEVCLFLSCLAYISIEMQGLIPVGELVTLLVAL